MLNVSLAATHLKVTGMHSPIASVIKSNASFREDNGFVLYYKSLAEEKFKWPRHHEEVMTLTGQQINWLLDGYDISAMQGHKKLNYESIF